jgi:excisionase family DNA binding protein
LSRVLKRTNKSHLTTGVIADYCGVSKITVLRWIAKGHLKAFRLPEGHYRIHADDFDMFCREHGMPVYKQWPE